MSNFMQSTAPASLWRKPLSTLLTLILGVWLVGCTGGEYIESADRMDVITIGDSIFDLNDVIQQTLESNAYAGQTFRKYTQSGAELSGGSLAQPVDLQYQDARATDANIDVVLMDGGGNDILIPAMTFDAYGCRTRWWRPNISSSCKSLIQDQYVVAVDLLDQMAVDGVQHVVYMGYYELPRGNANLNQAVNYGDYWLGAACGNTNADCQFIDPRGYIPASMVESDDIHPTPEGSRVLADLIWPAFGPLL